jgi:hypothetical protein
MDYIQSPQNIRLLKEYKKKSLFPSNVGGVNLDI